MTAQEWQSLGTPCGDLQAHRLCACMGSGLMRLHTTASSNQPLLHSHACLDDEAVEVDIPASTPQRSAVHISELSSAAWGPREASLLQSYAYELRTSSSCAGEQQNFRIYKVHRELYVTWDTCEAWAPTSRSTAA